MYPEHHTGSPGPSGYGYPSVPPPSGAGSSTGLLLLLGLLVAAMALPAVVLALIGASWMRQNIRGRWMLVAGLAVVGVVITWLLGDVVQDSWQTLGRAIRGRDSRLLQRAAIGLWTTTAPLAPAGALLWLVVRPQTVAERELTKFSRDEQRLKRKSQAMAQRVKAAPIAVREQLVFGAFVAGDLAWVVDGWCTFPERPLGRHLVAIGGSDSGKTESVLRLCYGAAKVYRWQVIYIDAKGDQATPTRFLATMLEAGVPRIALFPQQPYDGWRGTPTELFNRLISIETWTEPHYKSIAKLLLSLAIKAPAGPPRSSAELLQRLSKEALLALYPPKDVRRDYIAQVDNRAANGVFGRYQAFFTTLEGQLDGAWAFEDVGAAYITLDATAMKEEAKSLGRFLVADLEQYIVRRKVNGVKVLCVIDEWSALAEEGEIDGANLFERLRSAGGSVIVASQSEAGLGKDAARMVEAGFTQLIHRSSRPEKLVAHAGTVTQAAQQVNVEGRDSTGKGQLRFHEVPRVPPNGVRQLEQGECYLIAQGRSAHVRVAQIPITQEHFELARQFRLAGATAELVVEDGQAMILIDDSDDLAAMHDKATTDEPKPTTTFEHGTVTTEQTAETTVSTPPSEPLPPDPDLDERSVAF